MIAHINNIIREAGTASLCINYINTIKKTAIKIACADKPTPTGTVFAKAK